VNAFSPQEIARVCHAANAELQRIQSDPCPSLPWDAETEEARQIAVAGVEAALGGATPEELHAEWARNKAASGWMRGAFKDPQARTHPSLVPYEDLPEGERVKDAVFAAVTAAMSGNGTAPGHVRHLEAEAERLRALLEDQGRGGEAQEFLTRSEAARRLGVHPQTLRNLEDAGELTVTRTLGGHRRYYAGQVGELRRKRGVEAEKLRKGRGKGSAA
jgi:excisionase family DNA binding protein